MVSKTMANFHIQCSQTLFIILVTSENHRIDDKGQLKNVRINLANYVGQVQCLQDENARLCHEVNNCMKIHLCHKFLP